ncbi:MAG TPA: ATP-binding protein [Rhodothermia bacterium]|nr:ATP-binding protein [Rhodothermia bacterium]
MAKPRVAIDVEIPSDVKYIEQVVELATRQCRELHLPPHKCSLNVPVALSEALSNAILRGNAAGKGKRVRVRAVISDDAVVFDITDEGPNFDMEAKRVEPTPENVTSEEGRGLYLMYRLMDHVEHVYNRGNVIRLTLRRE